MRKKKKLLGGGGKGVSSFGIGGFKNPGMLKRRYQERMN